MFNKVLNIIRDLVLRFNIWFFVLVFLNAIPILIFQYYPTLDGPAHLYNVNLLKEILIKKNELVQQFFTFNTLIVPNWTSHFILFFLGLIFSPALSNKIFLLIIAIGLPLSIFNFIRNINPQNKILAVFSLLFIHTYLFGLGFYNYSLSIVIMFITLNYWIHSKNNRLYIRYLIMFVLVTLMYFSHSFLYITLLITIGVYTVYGFTSQSILNRPVKRYIIDFVLILIISIPTLILLYRFLLFEVIPPFIIRSPFMGLIKQFVDVRPLITHNYRAEGNFTQLLFYVIMLLFTYSIIRFLKELKNIRIKPLLTNLRLYLLIIAFMYIVLFFIYSNPTRDGGYIPVRIGIIMFLFILCWLSSLDYHYIIKMVSFITILIVNFGILFTVHKNLQKENELVKKILEASSLIKENTVVLPIRNYDHMLDKHNSNFLGLNKPVVILENYEASTYQFPLIWNRAELPEINLGDTILTNVCLSKKFPGESANECFVNYVIVWGDKKMDECKKDLMDIVIKNYDLIYFSSDPTVKLFELKSK